MATPEPASNSNLEPKTTSVKGNLFDILNLNKTMKCTFSADAEGTLVYGTSYVSGKNVRYVSEVKASGMEPVATNMLTDGEWVYTWSTEMQQGMKMKLDAFKETAATGDTKTENESPTSEQAKNFESNYDYNCMDWTGDPKMFELPQGLEFVDFSQTVESMMQPSSDGKSQMCAACSYAQNAEDKAACMKQFGC